MAWERRELFYGYWARFEACKLRRAILRCITQGHASSTRVQLHTYEATMMDGQAFWAHRSAGLLLHCSFSLLFCLAARRMNGIFCKCTIAALRTVQCPASSRAAALRGPSEPRGLEEVRRRPVLYCDCMAACSLASRAQPTRMADGLAG